MPPKEPEKEIDDEELKKRRRKWQILKPYMLSEIDKPFKDFNSMQKYYGIDVSHFQGDIDWDKVRDSKLHDRELAFVFMQCTYGLIGRDCKYAENIKEISEKLPNLKLK